jgi:hypothetical protein
MTNERELQLRQLATIIDPFRPGPKGEKLRAIGIVNFLLKMENPTVNFLEQSIEHLKQDFYLRDHVYHLTEQMIASRSILQATCENSGIECNHDQVIEGVFNTAELLNIFYNPGYSLDLNNLRQEAENVFTEIQLNKLRDAKLLRDRKEKKEYDEAFVPIGDQATRLVDEPDYEKRAEKARAIQANLLNFAKKFEIECSECGIGHTKTIAPIELQSLDEAGFLRFDVTLDGWISNASDFEEAAVLSNASKKRQELETLLESIIPLGKDIISQLRLTYGAKAANLTALEFIIDQLQGIADDKMGVALEVPPFKRVPVDLYRAWEKGALLDSDLKECFDWIQTGGCDYIVRSSAVFSEDGEKLTGAGKYESVIVKYGQTFAEFRQAVEKVYRSVNSSGAIDYRKRNGIEREEMGLIIQDYVISDRSGHANSELYGVKSHLEIVTERSRNFIKRDRMDFFLADVSESVFKQLHHFKPDKNKVSTTMLEKVGAVVMVLEKIWGQKVQIEFVGGPGRIHLVQIRNLPTCEKYYEDEIFFPNYPYIWAGAAVGVGDFTLPVLDAKNPHHSGENGVVIYESNDKDSIITRSVPDTGGIILCNDEGRNGHIQTFCAESGLFCVYPDSERGSISYEAFEGITHVRTILNGIEGRIYDVSE